MQTNTQPTEGKDPQRTTGESSLDGATCSVSNPQAEGRSFEARLHALLRSKVGQPITPEFLDKLEGEIAGLVPSSPELIEFIPSVTPGPTADSVACNLLPNATAQI